MGYNLNMLQKENPPKEEYKTVAKEIMQMAIRDQEMRFASQRRENPAQFDSNIDKDNTTRMKEIIREIGWPTITKVGKEASWASWLIVQHADHDSDFQAQCLELMKTTGDIFAANLAYLTDRVLVNSGKPQIFGTQLKADEKGNNVPKLIESEEDIDQKREAMGLNPLSDYLKRCRLDYQWSEADISPQLGAFLIPLDVKYPPKRI
jgi:hypothetical protein